MPLTLAPERRAEKASSSHVETTTDVVTSLDDEAILRQLKDILQQVFEIPPERVSRDAHLFTDLALDSIDAIDLVVQVQAMTGVRVKPEDFKHVRTVGDVVAVIHGLLTRQQDRVTEERA
jgi:acyl carrier protein